MKKFRCELGPLTLSVRESEPNRLDVRVVRRQAGSSLFEHALVIRPGTVLRLVRGRRESRYVLVKVFVPRLQYRGRCVAGGVVEVM